VLCWIKGKTDAQSVGLQQLIARRARNYLRSAANKNSRVIRALLSRGRERIRPRRYRIDDGAAPEGF
jgi:hypothetical protein